MTWDAPDETTRVDVADQGPEGTNWPLALLAIGGLGAVFVLGGWAWILTVLALIFFIFMHEMGHFWAAKRSGMKVTEFFMGFGPRIWSFRRGDTEFGIKAIWLGAYVKVPGMTNLEAIPADEEQQTYRAKPYRQRVLMASAGSLMHFAMALVLVFALVGLYGLPDEKAWKVGEVVNGSVAADAGLKSGDKIVAVEGVPMSTFTDVRQEISARPNTPTELTIRRGGDEFAVLVTPRPAVDEQTGDTVGRIGMTMQDGFSRLSAGDTVTESLSVYGQLYTGTLEGLGRIFSPSGLANIGEALMNGGRDSESGEVIVDRPSSIVGIGEQTSDAAREGAPYFLFIMAALNVGIGIFNLIPLLPLDGGHIAIATYERLRSRRGYRHFADMNKAVPLFYVTLVALGLLFMSSLYLDIRT
jgi:membrane-associated protease RseP (regulator of RpoE activity)